MSTSFIGRAFVTFFASSAAVLGLGLTAVLVVFPRGAEVAPRVVADYESTGQMYVEVDSSRP